MIMTQSFPLCRVLLAGLLLTVGACAGKVETTHESPDFSRADLAAGRLAVGGVVLSTQLLADPTQDAPDGVPADDLLAQADAWSPLLYGQLLAAGPDVPTWPWSALRDACPDSVLADALATIARGGVLKPVQLEPVAKTLSAVRYLALARVEANETSLHQGSVAAVENQRVKDGRDPHGSTLDRSLTTRREVTVTLDLYDLKAGRSVWTTTATRRRDMLYNYADAEDNLRPPLVGEGQPVITATGRPMPTADFTEVLGDACAALAQRLLTVPAS